MRVRNLIVLLTLLGLPASVEAQLQRFPGATALTANAQTCADSGDGSAGALTISVSGVSYVALTQSDSDGCDLTLSETGAQDGQLLIVVNLSANEASFADSAGVQELASGATVTLAQWASASFVYRSDRWVAAGGGGGTVCADDEVAIGDGSTMTCVAIPACDEVAEKLLYDDSTNSFSCETDQTASGAGSGDVVGPGSATDNALARFDSTTGKLIQNSVITASDAGALGLPDNVRQTFNPGANAAGLNVGCQSAAPDTPSNGDIYCDSDDGKMYVRISGAWVELGAGGASPGGSEDDLQANDGAGGLKAYAGDSCSVGEFVTAIASDGEVACGAASVILRKASDETVSGSDSLQSDDTFVQDVGANEVWQFEIVAIVASGSNTPDIKVAFSVPSGASVTWSAVGLTVAATNNESLTRTVSRIASTTDIAFGVVSTVETPIRIFGVLANSSNAGNLQFQWSQNTSNGTGTVVKAGSYALFKRVS